MWDEYTWIVVAGAFMAFFMAYGIGANDVANAFATSVGSKTLTLFQATCIAGVMEFAGALLLGRGVTKTVRKGIIDPDFFEDAPEVLMYGMLCALAAAGLWLMVATYLELPVSTTHSIIGGLVGFGLVAHGSDCVIWHEIDNSKDFPVKGISSVVISWVFSPVASGIVAAFFFLLTRTFILRAQNSFDRTFMFLPILVGLCFFINTFYVLDKGLSKQVDLTTAESAQWAAVSAVISIVLSGILVVLLKKKVAENWDKKQQAKADIEKGVAPAPEEEKTTSFFARLQNAVNSNDPHGEVDVNAETKDIHDNAEVFEDRTENSFRVLQVLTSAADSFAHGANDVANAVGPFAAIWGVYKTEALSSKSDTPEWILVIGGLGIVLGLATFGYQIIKAIGVKLTKITPSRGYAIELGSALVVVTGSYLGLPLSTTHCQVGATVAVGLIEGRKGISWTIFAKAVAGWIFTLIVVGLLSALLMALGLFTPNLRASEAIANIRNTVGETAPWIAGNATASCPNTPRLQTAAQQINDFAVGATEENYLHPNRIADVIEETNIFASRFANNQCEAQFDGVPQEVLDANPVPEPEEEE